MKPYLQIALPTGHVYEVNTAAVAQHHADAIMAEPSGLTAEQALEQATARFSNPGEIRNYVLAQMNIDELMATSRLVRFVPPVQDFTADAVSWTTHDAPAIIGELSAVDIMRQPIEAVLNTMADSMQSANVTVLNHGTAVFGAIGVFLGNENTVAKYIQAIQFTTNLLTNPSQPPDVVPHPTH